MRGSMTRRRTCRQPSPERMIMTRGSNTSRRMMACVSTSATMPPRTKRMKGVRITTLINVLRWVQAKSPSMHHQATSSSMRIAEKRRIRRSQSTRRRPGRSSTNRIITASTMTCARCVTNQAWCCAAQHATSSSTCTVPAQSCRRNLPTIGSAPTAVRRASWGGRRMGRNGAKQRMCAGRWSG
jgi:hypothetical protein